MRALILTAGEGKRLRPLTNTLPKCLIPVAGKPILDYQLSALEQGGVRDIWVVIGAHEEKVRAHLLMHPSIQTVFNAAFQTTNILYSFWQGLSDLRVDDDLIVLAGDVVFEEAVVRELLRAADKGMTLCINRKTCGEEEVKVVLESGRVARLGKKMDPARAYGEFLGVFLIRKEILPAVRRLVESMMTSGGKDSYLFDMINRLIDEDPTCISSLEVNDLLWEEIDFLEDIERVNARLLARFKG